VFPPLKEAPPTEPTQEELSRRTLHIHSMPSEKRAFKGRGRMTKPRCSHHEYPPVITASRLAHFLLGTIAQEEYSVGVRKE
jgi:hypothetical protein